MKENLLIILQELVDQLPDTEENKVRVNLIQEALELLDKLTGLLSVSAVNLVNQRILEAKVEAIYSYAKR